MYDSIQFPMYTSIKKNPDTKSLQRQDTLKIITKKENKKILKESLTYVK